MDLNVDCHLMILEQLEMFELLTLIESNRNFVHVVRHILRRKFITKTVIFLHPNIINNPKYTRINVEESRHSIQIRHFAFLSITLQYFGDLISSLTVLQDSKFTEEDAQHLYRSINLHCAGTLRKLHISSENDIFIHFGRSFEMVKFLSLNGRFSHLNNSNFTFSTLFPCVREMILNIEFSDDDWLDQKFPYLEYVKIALANNENINRVLSVAALERLIQSNLHIQSLSLRFVTPQILRMITEKLPQLEYLALIDYHETNAGDENIHNNFEHLKKIIVRNSEPTVPSRTRFGNLEEYQTNGYSMEWIQLIQRQNSLKKIRIDRWLHDFEVFKLANAASQLTEIQFVCGDFIEVAYLVRMIENHQNLKKIRLNTQRLTSWNDKFNHLQELLTNEWIIRNDIPYIIQFERIEHNVV